MPHTHESWQLTVNEADGRNIITGPPDVGGWPTEVATVAGKYAQLFMQAPTMYELLKEVEFCQRGWGGVEMCPVCSGHGEHTGNCRLAAVLKAAEGEERAR